MLVLELGSDNSGLANATALAWLRGRMDTKIGQTKHTAVAEKASTQSQLANQLAEIKGKLA